MCKQLLLLFLCTLLAVGCDSTTGDKGELSFSLAYDCQSLMGPSCNPKESLDHAVLENSSAYLLVTASGGSGSGSASVESSAPEVATCTLADVDGADWDWQGACQTHSAGSTQLSVRAGGQSDTVTLRVAAAHDMEGRFERMHSAADSEREGELDWGGGLVVDVDEDLKVSFWPTDSDGDDLVTADQPVRCEWSGEAVAIHPASCQDPEQREFTLSGRAPGEVTISFSLGELSRSLTVTVP